MVLAWWQRRRGVAGVAATAVMALSAFQLSYGREMRMYGFLALGGVLTAWAAERWLDDGRRRWIAVATVAATACAFTHATGIIVLLALGAIPLLRRDRRAWELRCAVLVGLASFALLWGAHAVAWRGQTSMYPKASLSWLSIVVNEVVAPVPSNRWIVLPLLVVGGLFIVARRDASTKVWLILAVGPVAALYVASYGQGVLIPKSLMAYSWGVALALGAVVGAAWKRSAMAGGLVAVVLALAVVPYVRTAVTHDEGAGGMVDALEEVVAPGDAIAVTKRQDDIRDLVEWYQFTDPGVDVAFDDTSVPGLRLVSVSGEEPSGRVWLVTSGAPEPIDGLHVVLAGPGGRWDLPRPVPDPFAELMATGQRSSGAVVPDPVEKVGPARPVPRVPAALCRPWVRWRSPSSCWVWPRCCSTPPASSAPTPAGRSRPSRRWPIVPWASIPTWATGPRSGIRRGSSTDSSTPTLATASTSTSRRSP